MNDDIIFVEKFYFALKEQNIKYCILRNADEVENGDAHDIDMSVDIKSLIKMEKTLYTTAKELGWKLHLKTGSIKDKNNIKCYHFFLNNSEIKIVHFDIFPSFTWNGMVLLVNQDLISDIDESSLFHKSNCAVEAVTKLFIRLLHNGYIKSKYKEYIYDVFNENKSQIITLMNKFLSIEISELIYNLAINNKWKKIEDKRKDIIIDIISKSKSQKTYIKNTLIHKKYLLNKTIKKAGLMIAFEGTDGSGKTTIIDGLPSIIGNSFPKNFIEYYHWRPGVIKKKNNNNGVAVVCTEPHSEKPYGKMKSFLKFMFFNLDYIIGYFIKIRIQLSKGRLVIFDRYYYDYYLDKIRYRLDISDKVLDFWKIFIPKPDATFLLVGDAQTLYERKKEIPVQEMQKQIDRLLINKHKFNNSIVIDVNQSIDKVVYEVSSEILNQCSKKYSGEV